MLFSDNMESFRIVNETEITDEVRNSNSSEKSAANDDKHSTPLTSQEQSFFPSQTISNIKSPPPPKVKLKVTKFSKNYALDLLKKMEDNILTAKQMLSDLAGQTFEQCSEEDVMQLEEASDHLRY